MYKSQILLALIVFLLSSAYIVTAQTDSFDCSKPGNPKVNKLVIRALAFEEEYDFESAIKTNKQILTIEPKNYCALNTIAGLYGILENFEEERVYAMRAIEINPKFANAYINLGNAQSMLGEIEEGEKSFKKAGELDPKSPIPAYSLGIIAEEKGDLNEAAKFYETSVFIDPGFENGYLNLAAVYANLKRFEDAKSALKKLLALNPDAEDAKDMLATIEKEP
ncbi:MAG: tetratricopeptide repeat protein [Pyrinomonadaceae bacterium]